MISVKGVSHVYFGYPECIHDISLELLDGEKFVLYGGTRSGKTTLMKILAGLIKPSKGEVSVNPINTREAAMIFEDLALPRFKSGRSILARPWRLRGMKRKEAERKAAEVAIKFGIMSLLDTPSILMDAYGKVRTAVARGFMRDAALTIIDNPLNRLKTSERRELSIKLAEYINASSGAVIYSTDDWNEIELYSGRIGILYYGRIVQVGTLNELKASPSCVAVAKLVSPKNSFIKGLAKSDGYTPVDEESIIESGVVGEFFPEDLTVTDDGDYPASYVFTTSDGTNAYKAFGGLIFAHGEKTDGYITPDFKKSRLYDIVSEKKIN
jgi:ABC-type sugar transport system ATPase subunit